MPEIPPAGVGKSDATLDVAKKGASGSVPGAEAESSKDCKVVNCSRCDLTAILYNLAGIQSPEIGSVVLLR